MVSITFKRALSIDTQRGSVAAVEPGVAYLLTDYHLGESIPRELTSSIEPFIEFERFDGRTLGEGSLLIMWLAGLGDTISAAPALLALQEQNPAARIDVASATRLFEIFCASGFRGRLLNYPTTTQAVREYDYFLPLERGGEDPDYLRLDSIDFYAKRLFQPPGLRPVRFHVDETAQRRMILPAKERSRVGIQVRGLSPLRTYPPDLLAELLRELVRLGYEVHLMGAEGDCDIPTAPPLLYNQCGSTANFAETLALVRQMDAVICPDSYLMHLAGALRVPTVALFSTMPARLRTGRYHSILALEPDTPCAPCMAIQDQQCPEGHSECLALRSGLLAPTAVIEALEKVASRSEPQPAI